MEVDKGSRSSSSRQRFTIELRPGETTIVSWKKLVKEANKKNNPSPPMPLPSTGFQMIPDSRLVPDQSKESEPKDPQPSNRLSAVVEKIELLYVGQQSSDEEVHDNVTVDDQYDTQDSFIDDTELDEYFETDRSTTKHNGFFINKGKLEQISQQTPPAVSQQKRQQKTKKSPRERDECQGPNKHTKFCHDRILVSAITAPLAGKSFNSQSFVVSEDHDPYLKISNKDAALFPVKLEYNENPRIQLSQCRDVGNNVGTEKELSDATYKKYQDRASKQFEPQVRRLMTHNNKGKKRSNELPDLNIPASNYLMQPMKSAIEASNAKPKGTALERAIRDLEKIVAESRPPNMDAQLADTSTTSIKRRLPTEVKQKLAKVARLAQSTQGRISDELINRLMDTVGHLVQLRTLKRNLREMVLLGLSAKREKADRFQQIKEEVTDMIKLQVPSKSMEYVSGDMETSDFLGDFTSEKRVSEGIYSMNNSMEDKICDLYDLYVQGMDEDKGLQIKKLYAELLELWPNGAMDNHGIKNAICRAKERRRALYNHDKIQEKVRAKKQGTGRPEEIVRGETSMDNQPGLSQGGSTIGSNTHILALPSIMISGTDTVDEHLAASLRLFDPSLGGSDLDRPKKKKCVSSSIPKHPRMQKYVQLESSIRKSSGNKEKESHNSHKNADPKDSRPQLAAPPSSC